MATFEKDIFEVVKTFRMRLQGFDETISGRINRAVSEDDKPYYFWEISHKYKPEKDSIEPDSPDTTVSDDVKECERYLLLYMNNFTLYGIVKDQSF